MCNSHNSRIQIGLKNKKSKYWNRRKKNNPKQQPSVNKNRNSITSKLSASDSNTAFSVNAISERIWASRACTKKKKHNYSGNFCTQPVAAVLYNKLCICCASLFNYTWAQLLEGRSKIKLVSKCDSSAAVFIWKESNGKTYCYVKIC